MPLHSVHAHGSRVRDLNSQLCVLVSKSPTAAEPLILAPRFLSLSLSSYRFFLSLCAFLGSLCHLHACSLCCSGALQGSRHLLETSCSQNSVESQGVHSLGLAVYHSNLSHQVVRRACFASFVVLRRPHSFVELLMERNVWGPAFELRIHVWNLGVSDVPVLAAAWRPIEQIEGFSQDA